MKYQLFIGGQWQDSQSQETYTRVNPANPDETLGEFQKGNAQDVKNAIDAGEDAFQAWSETPPTKRAEYIIKAGELLQFHERELSRTITREMGKTLREAAGEIQQTINIAYYAAAEGRRLLGHTTTSERDKKLIFTIRLPIGIVGLITPWNFPILIPARKIFYSLICGNSIVLKPSSEAPQSATRLIEILQKTGLPKGVINLITGPGEVVGNTLITDDRVRMISFCGHKDTGSKIFKNAGLKRVSLELGGKNPLIIMDDADIDLAVQALVLGGYTTTGQRCTASSRVIVHEKIKQKVEKLAVEQLKKLKIGDGLDPQTDIGPLVNQKALNRTKEYCQIGNTEGAKLLIGGQASRQLKGWYFEPTLFTDCKTDMRICKEEIFGPIVSIISAKNLQEAIDIANSVDYGLSSAIYTNNISNAFIAIKKLQAGLTYINHPTIGSQAHMPFGGVKFSGNNRESGPEGTSEFTELKTVYIDYQSTSQSGSLEKQEEPPFGSP